MKKILIYLAVICLAVSPAACSKSESPSGSMLSGEERTAVLAFSEPKTDNLIAGLNSDDYAVFSKDFDQDLLSSRPQISGVWFEK